MVREQAKAAVSSGEAQAVALTIAAGVMTFGTQQFTVGEPLTGGVAIAIGLVVFYGYQLAEQYNHDDVYSRLVEEVGEDTLKSLAEVSSDRIEEIIDEYESDEDQS